jgi:hypothetical protein
LGSVGSFPLAVIGLDRKIYNLNFVTLSREV